MHSTQKAFDGVAGDTDNRLFALRVLLGLSHGAKVAGIHRLRADDVAGKVRLMSRRLQQASIKGHS